MIPENPPPPEATTSAEQQKALTNGASAIHTPTQNGISPQQQAAESTDGSANQKSKTPSVKTHLSRELQHYYQRLVSALIPSAEERKRTAALTSLRADAGLAPVLPYIARWVAEGVVATLRRDGDGDDADLDRRSLDIYLDVINALLENERLLVEPYVSHLYRFSSSLLFSSSYRLDTILASSIPPSHTFNTPHVDIIHLHSTQPPRKRTHSVPSTNTRRLRTFASTCATRRNVPGPLSSRYQNSACCPCRTRTYARYARGRAAWSCFCG